MNLIALPAFTDNYIWMLHDGRSAIVVDRIESITGARPMFVEGDIRDDAVLERVFAKYRFDAVVHFAGLKAVGDSVVRPLDYYSNNVCGSAGLLK